MCNEAFARVQIEALLAARRWDTQDAIWAFMNTRHMKRVLFETARGAIGHANINSKELKAFRVPVPPFALQLTFEERGRAMGSLATQQSSALATAVATFSALLSKGFDRSFS